MLEILHILPHFWCGEQQEGPEIAKQKDAKFDFALSLNRWLTLPTLLIQATHSREELDSSLVAP